MGKSESFRFKDTVSQYKELEGHWETGMWVFGDGECNVLMIKERGFIYTWCLQHSKDWPGMEEGCLPWHCREVGKEWLCKLVKGFMGDMA